jgi:competence protein ComEC
MEKWMKGLSIGALALLGFFIGRTISFISAGRQEKIIVYNVPQHTAIDFICGRNYYFFGDADLLADDFGANFHLKPSRVLNRVKPATALEALRIENNCIDYNGTRILVIKSSSSYYPQDSLKAIDLLIVSGNPKVYISRIAKSFKINEIVFDGSVPFWKLTYWKRDCNSLHIPYHDASEKGAFVMNLN